jgi:hypothetical protein
MLTNVTLHYGFLVILTAVTGEKLIHMDGSALKQLFNTQAQAN